jgi:hypothetical protein
MDRFSLNKKRIDNVRENITKNYMVSDGPPEGFFLPKEYLEKMKEVGEKYKNVRWLPLDIPKIEFDDFDEFEDIWKQESIEVLRIKPDVAEPWTKDDHPYGPASSWHIPQFQGLTIWRNPRSEHQTVTFAEKLYTGQNKQFDRIVDQAFTYFPIHTMFSIFIWKSTMEIKPHRDRSSFWKCPTEFRSMLYDENPDPTLYVADIEHGDMHYIDLPKDTNSFCWSNGTQIHGSDYYGKNKYLLCISGIQHSKKSDELFERSINKYKDVLNYKLDL